MTGVIQQAVNSWSNCDDLATKRYVAAATSLHLRSSSERNGLTKLFTISATYYLEEDVYVIVREAL